MSEIAQEERTCRFPGCERPAAASDSGTGRPPEYCDDPGHTRGAAWRERQRLSQQGAGSGPTASVPARPVDAARVRASEIRGQVAGMIEHLEQQLAQLVEELRTTGDPDAAEAQIESVSTEAAEQVAAANARANRAEQAQRRAEAERAEADAAAEEATAAVERLAAELEEQGQALAAAAAAGETLTVELAAARAAAEAEQERHDALVADLGRELANAAERLVAVEGERDEAEQRREDAVAGRAQALEQAREATARAQRAQAAVEAAAAERDDALRAGAQLREQLAEVRGSLGAVTAERDAARADIDRERAHGDQRVQDLRAGYDRQLSSREQEVDALRVEIREQRARADRLEGQLAASAANVAEPPAGTTTKGRRRTAGSSPRDQG